MKKNGNGKMPPWLKGGGKNGGGKGGGKGDMPMEKGKMPPEKGKGSKKK